MNKIFLLLIFSIAFSTITVGQGVKLSVHGGLVGAEEGDYGFGLGIAPGIQVNEHLAFYIRGELVSFTRELDTEQELTDVEIDASLIGSISVATHVYFSSGKVRPFFGGGVGYYVPGEFKIETVTNVATATAESRVSETIAPEPAFGFFPRLGLEVGLFSFMVDYHIVEDSRAEYTTLKITDVNNETTTVREDVVTDFKNSYLSVRIGLTIGGNK